MAQRVLFILLLYCTSVLCEQCVTENFEDGLNGFSSDSLLCSGLSTFTLGNYSTRELSGLNPNSAVYLTPDESVSCVSSYVIPMVPGGVLEVNIYASGIKSTDFLTILINNDDASVVATNSIHSFDPNIVDDWQVVTLTVISSAGINGYVTLMGVVSDDAIILIDSFRYIAPGYDEVLCQVYNVITDPESIDAIETTPVTDTSTPAAESVPAATVTTTISTTGSSTPTLEITTSATTESTVNEDSECLTYNFETQFEILFSNDKEICRGFQPWNIDHYDITTTERPNGDSGTFIYPNEDLSCIASFLFPMEIRGIVELNVYMESNSEFVGSEQISVMVMENIADGVDVVTGTAGVSTLDSNYVDGWRTIRIQLFGTGSFNGYITMFGSASENSTVLVDSFRYIPPTFDERYCYIYESNAPVETTVQPMIESCVSYDIKEDFNERFTTSQEICNGFAPWSLATYRSTALPNEESEYAIAANDHANCVSSFPFLMSPAGVIQVRVYMEPIDPMIDHIIILAKKFSTNNGQDTVNGYVLHTPSEENYEDGWQILNVTLSDLTSFYGYVTFLGAAAEGSTVLIDSFKYIPPYEEDC